MGLSTIFRASALGLALLAQSEQPVFAQSPQTSTAPPSSTLPLTPPSTPPGTASAPVAAPPTPEATAIAQAMALCMPQHLSLTTFEQYATAAGWPAFRTAQNSGHNWRLSDRNADSIHRVSVAAASYEMTGAPRPTHEFSCKIVLQPGTEEVLAPSIAATFGDNETEGGFFIVDHATLRPMNFNENLTPFPASLANLQAGQRMVFMEMTQRQNVTIVSIDSFEPSGAH
jgi:hypothetical protein